MDRELRHREPVEDLGHHRGDLGLDVPGEGVLADHVEVRLVELAEAAVLRALATPDLLDLEAPQREGEVVLVLEYVAGQWNGEVEVQPQGARLVVPGLFRGVLALGVEAAQHVHLLVDLSLAQQLLERFDGARLDAREPMQLGHLAEHVDHVLFHETLRGEPLREA